MGVLPALKYACGRICERDAALDVAAALQNLAPPMRPSCTSAERRPGIKLRRTKAALLRRLTNPGRKLQEWTIRVVARKRTCTGESNVLCLLSLSRTVMERHIRGQGVAKSL